MSKGFGIASLVIVLISFITPLVGMWVAYIALLLAGIAALLGNKGHAIATTIIGIVKLYLLSPILMTTMYLPFADKSAPPAAYMFLMLTTFFAAIPIVCFIFRPALRVALGKMGVTVPANPESGLSE